ncbi:MAG: hypothetical protein KQH53_11240 [Desulfarculaceae bacterium]|nr:hypothetical protein [Desulfarculaceae bacterium]
MSFWSGAPRSPALVAAGGYEVEINFGLSPERQEELRPELRTMLHAAFIDHPDYDQEHLPQFLGADLYLRLSRQGEPAGIFCSELLEVGGEPVLHLILGLSPPELHGGGQLQPTAMGLTLELTAQAFGTAEFLVGLRTANPRVVSWLWRCPWVRFYPRRDWGKSDPQEQRLRRSFCDQVFGEDHCSLDGRTFRGIYPVHPWGGAVPWHHDERVNAFCREHISDHGSEAILFLGPTLPAVAGLPRRAAWPKPKA